MKRLLNNGALLAVCLICLLCFACTVTPEEYKEAQNACEPHGGLVKYHNPFTLSDKIVGVSDCASGSSVSSPVIE